MIQLANYYFVFQGVIFTTFYNSPPDVKCCFRWLPFTLSFLAGSFNIWALFTIAFKYKTTLDDIDRNEFTVPRGSGIGCAAGLPRATMSAFLSISSKVVLYLKATVERAQMLGDPARKERANGTHRKRHLTSEGLL
ncbi:UNVERIFIED_CONTAM: hypothetical protein Slati_3826200 [Sesamum latifolium]|uniref:Uncharacterized protein n=1 Tax=Sesamum latifolium TaxID=2727402 RepID=A0AAW2TLN0_9LAMI